MAERKTPFKGSSLESDSVPGDFPSSEMASPSGGGMTRPSTGRHGQGVTVTDGCGPVRQTLRSAELNRYSKAQGGSPIDEYWPQRTPWSTTEKPIPDQTRFGSGTIVDPVTAARQPFKEQRPFGSGSFLDQMTAGRQLPQKQRPFDSGTSVDQLTFFHQQSPERKTFDSGTFAVSATVARQPLHEQRAFGSGSFLDQITADRQLPQQRSFGTGTSVDQMTVYRLQSPELKTFGNETFANPITVAKQSSSGQKTFRSGTFVDQTTVGCRSSPEQPIFGSGTSVNQMEVDKHPSPELKTFGSGTFVDPRTIASQSSPEQGTRSPVHLSADGVMEDGEYEDEDSRQSSVMAAMDTWTLEDDGVESKPFVDSAVFAQDEDGDTYLHLAIISGRSDLAQCLIHLAPGSLWLDQANHLKQTPLHLATDRRQPTVIRRLLNRGAKRVVHDKRGNTPLHIACLNGYLDCVQELTASNPASVMTSNDLSFNEPNYEGQTCLHLAASKNHIDVIRYLVENCRLNINQKELRRGCTILHRAVMTSNLELLNYLLSLPASVELIIDEQTYDGYTALSLASLTPQSHFERMLLLAGAT